jgi:hypothetical protein
MTEVAPPQLFHLGKDSAYFPGQWLSAGGVMKKVGIPTAAQHRFLGECTDTGVKQGQGIEVVPGSHVYNGQYQNGARSGLGTYVVLRVEHTERQSCRMDQASKGHNQNFRWFVFVVSLLFSVLNHHGHEEQQN